ncbi:hypothetical protein H5410_030219 [Solanum commersonii]|uniref:Non-haem dioxygenase N-terminal domain-containing protein n=1 Tax=Solanum commersonii TaxID=4109 RepID=A0A9J5YF10_SOLCO|nr:hypothetical protein H5410_030219 [Solanum commersonii]
MYSTKRNILDKSQIDNQESIPTIDLSNFYDLNVEKSIQEATTKWGCFQIINHGISIEVLEDLKDAAHKFFQLLAEEKVNYCKDSYSAGESVLMFWSAIVSYLSKQILKLTRPSVSIQSQKVVSQVPSLEYQKLAKPLAKKLLEV